MNLFKARIISAIIAILMATVFFSPVKMSMVYLFFRPLVQPYGDLKYMMFGQIPITSVFSFILIGAAYFTGITKRNCTIAYSAMVPLYLILLFSTFSLYSTPTLILSVGSMIKLIAAIAMYTIVSNAIQEEKDVDKILWAIVLCTIFPMIYGYYQYVTGTGHAWKSQYYAGKRIDSFLGEFNSYGEFLCLGIIAGHMLINRLTSKVQKKIVGLLMVSLFLSLLFSQNRGSWISLFLGYSIASVPFRKRVNIKLVVVAGFVVVVGFGGFMIERFLELGVKTEWGSKNTFAGRMEITKALWPIALQNPIFGHGIGASSVITKQLLGKEIVPHNDYMRLMVETGLPGALFYIYFFLAELIRKFTNIKREKNWSINYPIMAATIYLLVLSFFQNIIQNMVVYPMFLSLLAITHRYNKIRQPEVSEATNKKINTPC